MRRPDRTLFAGTAVTSSPSAAGPQLAPTRPVQKREIFAWCMYDWANSAYSTLQITVLMAYLTLVVVPGPAGKIVYGWGIGLTMLAAAVMSPVLGAIADARASKRTWLALTTLPAAAAAAAICFVPPERTWLVVLLFVVANLGYELSQGFYNAFLPEIADDKTMNRVSAWGFALGYIGGGVALILAMLVVKYGDFLGFPSAAADASAAEQLAANVPRMQVGLLIMGLWWGLFSLPTILVLRDRVIPRQARQTLSETTVTAFREVGRTLRNVRVYRTLFIFLLAFLIYNDGVQTIITQAGVFAQEVLKIDVAELTMVVLMIQFAAMPGAMLMGWLAERLGQKQALLLCLGIYILWLFAAFFISNRVQFWLMGAVLAMIMGGVQSVSRAIMGLLTPASRSGEFFGFFNLSGKATSVVGPILFSSILAWTKSPQLAILSLLIFFLAGGGLMLRVNIKQGQIEAAQ
jgi:MFS transporter, UMF1 family